MGPLFRNVEVGEYCCYGTNRFTGSAVDAFIGVDVIDFCFVGCMNAVDWANIDARGVLGAYARLADRISHEPRLPHIGMASNTK